MATFDRLRSRIKSRVEGITIERGREIARDLREKAEEDNRRFYPNLLSSIERRKSLGQFAPLNELYADRKFLAGYTSEPDRNSFYEFTGSLKRELAKRDANTDFGQPDFSVRLKRGQKAKDAYVEIRGTPFGKAEKFSVDDLIMQIRSDALRIKLGVTDAGKKGQPPRPLIRPALDYALTRGFRNKVKKWLKTY